MRRRRLVLVLLLLLLLLLLVLLLICWRCALVLRLRRTRRRGVRQQYSRITGGVALHERPVGVVFVLSVRT